MQNFNVTKPYFVDIITSQSELPILWGYPQPEPVGDKVYSASWGTKTGDPNNKVMFDSRKPETYTKVGAKVGTEFQPIYDPYRKAPIFGPLVRFSNRI